MGKIAGYRGATTAHYHPRTEELYYVVAGRGRMRLAAEERDVGPGDCVVIPPGTEHKLTNTGDEDLRLLCCCAPAYTHEATSSRTPSSRTTTKRRA